jgi:predicted amidohydrolase YtcJ
MPATRLALFPWRELVEAGAWISAGTDHPIGPLDPLLAIYGMTTRRTPAGVLGPEHAIGRAEAIRLYTVAGARFLRRPAAATLVPGAPADLAGYPADPFTCPAGQLPELAPAFTVTGGRVTHRGLSAHGGSPLWGWLPRLSEGLWFSLGRGFPAPRKCQHDAPPD